jgi:hypothetical protein
MGYFKANYTRSVTIAGDDVVVPTDGVGLILLASDSTTATDRTFTLQVSSEVGQQLTLVFTAGSSYTCQLADTGTMKLQGGAWTPLQYDTLQLISDGTNWVELGRSVASGVTDIALADAHILVGNSSGLAADVAVTGDVTITNAGVTAIASGVIVNADVSGSAAIDYSKMATMTGDVTMTANASAIGAGKVTEAMLKAPDTVGLGAKRLAYVVFDPSAVAGDRTVAAHALGTAIPDDAFVTGAWYWVETTCTSATDAGTIAISIEGADDVVAAIAISDGTNPWDTSAKPVEGITKLETTSTWLATTAARQITATVAVEALTAGKVHIWAEYIAY